ncbi:MAG: hypothetical protein E7317_02305 [Clostridiales bacterium]|nr:hypothetical protein [Clostridiales bacterium]
MPLPGSLSIGLLSEDNPLKSFFCYCPLLIEKDGAFRPFEERALYPERGTIRIVPDKNESSHFKIRMRRIGALAMVDLRAHPGENDKIRPNKNYHGDGTEPNAYIIYSDVIMEPAPGLLYSILDMAPEDAENAILETIPTCPDVLLRAGEGLTGEVWRCVQDEHQPDVTRLTRTELKIDPARVEICAVEVPDGAALTLAVDAARMPAQPAARETERQRPQPAQEEARPQKPAPQQPAAPASAPAAAPVREEKAPPVPAKPWLNPNPAPAPKENARGKGLKEIIDDKWRHSRLDQLGTPVPELTTGDPLMSPAERASREVKRAWEIPEAREELLNAIARLDGADEALAARREALKQSAVNSQLTELESERLKMLDDLATLRKNTADVREELKDEIRRDEANLFADAVRKTERAKAAQAKAEEEAKAAQVAAQGVQDALTALEDGRFEERLSAFAVNSRAVQLIRGAKPSPAAPEIEGEDASAEEIIHRVRARFSDAGAHISQTDAVNMLICAVDFPVTIVSGAVGAGKTTHLRLLADALGIADKRLCVCPAGKGSLSDAPEIAALRRGSVPGMLLLDDMNLKNRRDPLRGLRADEGDALMLTATVQDEGDPLPGWLLGRAALIRLADERPDSFWAPKEPQLARTYAPVSTEALRRAFGPGKGTMPHNVLTHMDRLRKALSLAGLRLSRGTLDRLWTYCAAAIPLMPLEGSAVLDMAFAQLALPLILATAPVKSLHALSGILSDMPRSLALMEQPLPIEV